uniref:Uncharacterized protein n=1 Tax=Arundo donax TaxID=35708 RepID=A0A0A9LDU6_ARUDO
MNHSVFLFRSAGGNACTYSFAIAGVPNNPQSPPFLLPPPRPTGEAASCVGACGCAAVAGIYRGGIDRWGKGGKEGGRDGACGGSFKDGGEKITRR